uniref:Baseplate protein n=1 Tax=Siphoviridae sp. ctB9E3 TaxID=2826187 RepID=A0A8S5QQA1_9CAUD|nr:MAG TPA: baseplate protein [Siphoviridae sp. ctB9E3]
MGEGNHAVRDSVTLEQQPFPFFGNVLRLQKHKGLVIATVSASPKSTSKNLYDVAANETIANGFRPSSRDAIMTSVSHGGDVASALIHPDGRIGMFGTLTVGHHYLWQGVWPTE